MFKVPFLVVILAFVVSAEAQNFLSTQADAKKSPGPFQFGLRLNIDQVSYSSVSAYDKQDQQRAELTLGHQQKGFVFSSSELTFGTSSEPKSFYLAAPEVYVGIGDKESSFIALGRLKKNFNFLDSYYNLSLYNSFFTNDFIRFKEQGLTGLHLQAYNGFWGAYVGWHPLYLPNQEPQVHEERGSLVSSNRWAVRPPPQFQFADKDHPIEYAIRDYSITEIISNQGYAASAFVGEDPKRPFMQVSYANHPLNAIPLSRDTYGTAMDFVGHVNLSPMVTYQEVSSVDMNYDFLNIQTTLSYAEDRIQNKVASENEALQNLSPMQVYGLYVAADVSPWVRRQLIFSIAAAEIKGGQIIDLDQNGKESIFTFSNRRSQFRAPVTLGLATDLLFIRDRAIKTQVRWTYDRTDKGALLSTQLGYEIIPRMSVHLGADIIGVESQLQEDQASNFLDRNQANDRVYGGLQYAF